VTRRAGLHPCAALCVLDFAFGNPGLMQGRTAMPDGTDSTTLDDAIRENAAGPKRAQGDAGSVEQHGLKDQIEADRYLASKRAAAKPARAIRLTRLVPPGAAGEVGG
jgi:hypothetical protein